MHAIIDPKSLADMASALENHELGAAVRLLNRMLATGKPVQLARARTICQFDETQWVESSAEILSHFKVDEDKVSHRILEEASLPAVSTQARTRNGSTAEMPIVHPTKVNRVPAYVSRDKPEIISMKRTAYIMMKEIFERSDQSENTARVLLSSLLKSWPEGDVYEAISAAEKQKYLVDPRAWIVKHLQRNSRPVVAARSRRETCPPPERKTAPREIVTPKSMGVSSATANRIRERNKSLHLDLGNKRHDA